MYSEFQDPARQVWPKMRVAVFVAATLAALSLANCAAAFLLAPLLPPPAAGGASPIGLAVTTLGRLLSVTGR